MDKQLSVSQPVGMTGMRLDVRAHVVSVSVSAVQNLLKCARSCGLEPIGMALHALASSNAVLSPDAREMGACVIDIGGGTTDVIVSGDNTVHCSLSIPVGGWHITSDISRAFSIPREAAEKIKIDGGCAFPALADLQRQLQVGIGEERRHRAIGQQDLSSIIAPRMEEIFVIIKDSLERAGIAHELTPEFVLTGDSSVLAGMAEVAAQMFNAPVRVAPPAPIEGMPAHLKGPAGAAATGLLLHAYEQTQRTADHYSSQPARLAATLRASQEVNRQQFLSAGSEICNLRNIENTRH